MKKIFAFYGLFVCIILDIFLVIFTFYWFFQENSIETPLTILWTVLATSIPTLHFYIHKIEFNLDAYFAEATYVVNWRNNYDLNTNWILHIDEIESAEVVYLTRKEKKMYTSTKFLFNKYIKINHKYGNSKYLYVFWFSNRQIKKIIKLLTNNC